MNRILLAPGTGFPSTCRAFLFREDAPADSGSIRDSTPRKRHVRSWARRADSGTLARCRPVDARSTSTARHGTGTLRESRGCAGRVRFREGTRLDSGIHATEAPRSILGDDAGNPVRSPSRPVARPVDARSGFREGSPVIRSGARSGWRSG